MAKKGKKKSKPKEAPEICDNHFIQSDWELIKQLISNSEEDMNNILYLRRKNAIARVRKNLMEIKRICHYLRKSLSCQKQDNDGFYD